MAVLILLLAALLLFRGLGAAGIGEVTAGPVTDGQDARETSRSGAS